MTALFMRITGYWLASIAIFVLMFLAIIMLIFMPLGLQPGAAGGFFAFLATVVSLLPASAFMAWRIDNLLK